MNTRRELDGHKSGSKAEKAQKPNKQITPKKTGSMEKRSGSKGKRTKSNPQICVGTDVHKKTIQMAVINKNNKILKNENISHTPSCLKGFPESLPKNTKYVMESSSVWYNTFRTMRDEPGLDVILLNPYQTRLIAASTITIIRSEIIWAPVIIRPNFGPIGVLFASAIVMFENNPSLCFLVISAFMNAGP